MSETSPANSHRSVKHTDPMPVSRLGMWLFLASEAMFFVGLLSAFIVLGSAGSQHELFVKSSRMLSPLLGVFSAVALTASSGAINSKRGVFRWIAIAAAFVFLMLQAVQWGSLLSRHTVVYHDPGGLLYVCDGTRFASRQIPLPPSFDIHRMTAGDFSRAGEQVVFRAGRDPKTILLDNNYGPSRNNFFACYFVMTAAHVLHLLAGMLAVFWFLIFAKGKLPDAVQIYWHFVNAVGIVALAALYFV